MSETESARPGSYQDLSKRMDRMETNHGELAKEVANLTGTVARVELNQTHLEKLSELRFGALDTGVKGISDTLERFMGRINAIISGEVRMPQTEAIMRDYQDFREDTEERLDKHDRFETQGRLLGRIAVLLVTSNLIAIVAGVAALLK